MLSAVRSLEVKEPDEVHELIGPVGESLPQVMIAAEMPEDELIRRRAEKLRKCAARIAIEGTNKVLPESQISRYPNLLEATRAAARGEPEAVRFVEANVSTDVFERSIKSGHVTSVDVDTDKDGRIIQNGQYLDDVHINTFAYGTHGTEMSERFMADARNGKRAEHHHRQGRLATHYFMELSPVADLPEADLRAAGFFTDTMSMVIRLWSAEGSTLRMYSAFVAGVTRPDGPRHDQAMIAAIGKAIGVDFRRLTANELLDSAVLVDKRLFPDGILDPVRIADEGAGTFFGQARPQQDYRTYLAECRRREAELQPTIRHISAELIQAAPRLRTPNEATDLLHGLSEKQLVKRSLTDTMIDPMVFGSAAAAYIFEARSYIDQGDIKNADKAMAAAEKTAVSSSCPNGKSTGGTEAETSNSTETTSGAKKSGIVKMTCPLCKDPNQYGDPCSPNQHCTNCSARVVNGKLVNGGDGGRKARQVRAFKAAQALAALRQNRAADKRSDANKPGRLHAISA